MKVPDVLLGYEDVHFTAAEIAERQAVISQNSQAYLQAWREGKVNPGLYAYQEPAFEALLEFTHETGLAIQPSLDEMAIESGYLDEPTSFGKTALMAKYLGAVGIGALPTPESPMPLRALISTFAAYAVKQTASAVDVTRGLKKFLPDMDISMCFTEHKNLSGEISVITYKMLRLLDRADLLKNYYVDVVLGDEAHNLLGRETNRVWRSFTRAKRAIGLTASPEYASSKKLSQLFDRVIHESNLRSHVEAGNVSSVKILGLGTGVEIAAPARAGNDFSDANLKPLILDPGRNQAICDVTAQMIAEGRRGVVNALPGQHKGQTLFHPRLLAKALNGREIEDDFGNKRQIRAAAIGTHITPKRCEEILEAFKKGEYDVILQVDKINQSFDCEDVAFIVNAAPTMSPVRAIQRLGRLMRINEEWPIKIIVEFIDDIKGKRIPHTAWHVLGERTMKQDQVIATPELVKLLAMEEEEDRPRQVIIRDTTRSPENRPISVPDPNVFSDLLKAMHHDYTLRLIGTFTLRAKEGYGPPQQGWRPLQTIVAEKHSDKPLGIDGIRGVLERAGEKAGESYCELALGRGPMYFISPAGEEFLAAYEFPKAPPSRQWKTERELTEVLDTTREVIQRCSAGLERTTYLAHRINREHEHFGPEAIEVLKMRVEELKRQEEEAQTLIAARDLAAEPEVNWNRASINYFLTSHYGIEGRMLKNPGAAGPDARFYTEEEADIVRRHRRHSYQVPQKELAQRKVIDLERETGRTREDILAAAAALGFENRVKDGRHKDKDGAYIYSELTTPWVAKQISEYFQNAETNPVSQPEAASTPSPEPAPAPPTSSDPPPPPRQAKEIAPEAAESTPTKPQPVTFMAAGKIVMAPPGGTTTPPPAAKLPAPTPPPQPPKQKLPPAEQLSESAPAGEEEYVDVLKTLESYGAPCDLGAVRRVVEECGLGSDAVKRRKGGLAASQDTILAMAAYISGLPEAMPDVETPADLAYRLGLHVDEVIEIVGKLNHIDKRAMVGLYKRSRDTDNPGVVGLFFELELRALVEKACRNRRIMLPNRDKNARGPIRRR